MTVAASRRFWELETAEEVEIVGRVLRHRFSGLVDLVSGVLESADPLDIVYPDNPDEYDDVLREFFVLASPPSGDFNDVTPEGLDTAIRTSLRRCFDDMPDESAVRSIVEQLLTLDLEAESRA